MAGVSSIRGKALIGRHVKMVGYMESCVPANLLGKIGRILSVEQTPERSCNGFYVYHARFISGETWYINEVDFHIVPNRPPRVLKPGEAACQVCGRVHTSVEFYTAVNKHLCTTCRDAYLSPCEDCGAWVKRFSIVSFENWGEVRRICTTCFDTNYTRCDCGHIVTNGAEVRVDGRTLCGDCTLIREYSYKPIPKFLPRVDATKKSVPLYMGVELEVETGGDYSDRHDKALVASELLPDAYLKNDGSIDCGFEIVSHPATLEYHQKAFGWDVALPELDKLGVKSHDTSTCGLHIHVNKEFLSDCERVKLGLFIYTQKKRLEKVARRKSSEYAQYKTLFKGEISRGAKGNTDGNRYEALNWLNKYTVEFRLFKGTLNLDTFLATLEFIDCLCKFVKTVPTPLIADPNKAWAWFTTFAKEDTRSYLHLIPYLEKKHLLGDFREIKSNIGDPSQVIRKGCTVRLKTTHHTSRRFGWSGNEMVGETFRVNYIRSDGDIETINDYTLCRQDVVLVSQPEPPRPVVVTPNSQIRGGDMVRVISTEATQDRYGLNDEMVVGSIWNVTEVSGGSVQAGWHWHISDLERVEEVSASALV
jgi:hypothetical protein